MAKQDKHPKLQTRNMKQYFVHDTMEVFYNPHDYCTAPYFIGLTTEARIARETNIEKIYGGLHNKVIAISETDEGMTIGVDTALFYADDVELRFGQRAKDGQVTITEIEMNEDGTFKNVEKEVEGTYVDLKAGDFAKSGSLQLHTVAYDSEQSDKIVADIYFIFPNVKPASAFEYNFTMAENMGQTIEFIPQVKLDNETYGQYIVIERDIENNEDKTCGFETEGEIGV